MRSSARGIESGARSSSIWRASSARLSSRSVRTRRLTARRRGHRRDRPSRRRARRPRRGSSGPRRSRAALRPRARRVRARAGRRPARRGPARARRARPPRTRKRAASSAACGSSPPSTTWRTSWKWACACMLPPMTPKGPGRRPSRSSSPGMIVWNGRLPRGDPVGVALLLGEAGAAVLQRDPRVPHRHARAEALEDRLDPRHGVALAVDGAQVGRAAAGPHARVGCGTRPDARPQRAGVGQVDRGVADRASRPVERELGRLDVAVQVAVELLGDPEGHERRRSLRVGRQLADLDAAVRAPQRRDPLGAVRGEVVLGEPARRGDGGGDRPLVDRVGSAIGDRLQRRGEVGQAVALGRAAARATAPAPAPRASARRSAPWPPRRCAPRRSRRPGQHRARAARSARPRRTTRARRRAPSPSGARRGRRSARRCAPAPAPSR